MSSKVEKKQKLTDLQAKRQKLKDEEWQLYLEQRKIEDMEIQLKEKRMKWWNEKETVEKEITKLEKQIEKKKKIKK